MIYKLIVASLFITQLSAGFHFLRKTFASIRPSPTVCAAAFAREVPASPCLVESGTLTIGASSPGLIGSDKLDDLCVVFFCFGVLVTALASAVLYKKHLNHLKSSTSLSSTIPSAFGGKVIHYLQFMTQKRYVQVFQTFASLVSIIVWAISTTLPDKINLMLEFFNPEHTVDESKTIALWYSCGSHRLELLVADLTVQGCVAFSLIIWLLSPVKPQAGDYRFATIDFLQVASVLWALPASIHLSSSRAYNLYLLSGFFRTVRIFEGVPELARHYNLLASDSKDRFQKQHASSFQLLLGQFALVVKILFFLSFSSLLLIAVEGWPCVYHVVDRSPCECFVEFRNFAGTIYFVFTTMTTVGFGDIVPRTSLGRLAVITLIVTGVYLAPTWIGQLKKQHTQYVNAKRSEQAKNQKRGQKHATAEAMASRGNNRNSVNSLPGLGEEDELEELEELRREEQQKSPRPTLMLAQSDAPPPNEHGEDFDEHAEDMPHDAEDHQHDELNPNDTVADPTLLRSVSDFERPAPLVSRDTKEHNSLGSGQQSKDRNSINSQTKDRNSINSNPQQQQPQQKDRYSINSNQQHQKDRLSINSQMSAQKDRQSSFRAKLGAVFGRLGSTASDGERKAQQAQQQQVEVPISSRSITPLSPARPVAEAPTLHAIDLQDDKPPRETVGRAEWGSALMMIEKQNAQMDQQQAMLQYLLDFMVEVSTTESQQRVVREVVTTLRNIPHHDLELPVVAPTSRRGRD
eukprot:c32195_g1_i1.p1 GENE.c32195_g1_i1~~c32195_g1_i1.p1  ORF type:complete len:745 (-),score=157.78 c32195_g1_i1:143-2377(-)